MCQQMKVEEFLELKYGITLTDEKMPIDPKFFIKVMEEYAKHKIEEAQALKVISYSFTGRSYNDALAIAEAKQIFDATGNENESKKRLIQEGWDLRSASKYIKEHF